MNKKKNIKIKHSKGRLYKKRKSKGRKVLETLVLVILAGGLIFVGYSAAGPLIAHLSGGENTDDISAPWTPSEITSSDSIQNTGDSETNLSSSETKAENLGGSGSYLLPQSALENGSSLSNALSEAKKAGFTVILVPVKDTSGNLLYKSSIEYVKDTELIKGTLYAGQIVSAAKTNGLIPKAVIPTLMDSGTPGHVEDTGYTFASGGYGWLDNTAENGGKRWVDPFLDGTKKYYSDLSEELNSAGFEEIIISELRFPDFNPIDESFLLARCFEADRYKALTALYKNVFDSSDKKTAVSINAKDVLDGYGKSYGRTAEILKDKSFTGIVYLTVDLTKFDTELKTGEDTSVKLSADPVKKASQLIGKAVEYVGTNITVVPVILPNGISDDTLIRCYKGLAAE